MSRIERSRKELLTNCLIRNFGRSDLKETANRNVKKKQQIQQIFLCEICGLLLGRAQIKKIQPFLFLTLEFCQFVVRAIFVTLSFLTRIFYFCDFCEICDMLGARLYSFLVQRLCQIGYSCFLRYLLLVISTDSEKNSCYFCDFCEICGLFEALLCLFCL